jgi:hypothetical protein
VFPLFFETRCGWDFEDDVGTKWGSFREVLIQEELVNSLQLPCRHLPKPEYFDVAMHDPKEKKIPMVLSKYCKIRLNDPSSTWHAK